MNRFVLANKRPSACSHAEGTYALHRRRISVAFLLGISAVAVSIKTEAQQAGLAAQTVASPSTSASAPTSTDAAKLTVEDAIARARANEPAFAAAVAAGKVAALDHSIARAGLLPSVVYHNQYLYTEAAHGPGQSANASASVVAAPRFIANNAVHEYTSQGVVSETLGVQQVTAMQHAAAASAVAAAELEIAQRGLIATVVGLYYGSLAAEQKVQVAQRALDEAMQFSDLTHHREEAREAAHADLVKSQLQQQQRQRDLEDAKLQSEKARLDLGVLLYPDPRTPYTLVDATAPAPLPSREELEAAAEKQNPELKSAMASLRASRLDVTAARAAYLPDLGLNFAYGIDAPEFAVHGPDGSRNLGYSATVSLDIPVWDWLATHDRVRQKESLRDSARITLSAAQRRLIADIDEGYSEATVARGQMDSLDQSVATARESLRLVKLRYTAGESSVLEVVDAQNSLAATELAREDGVLRYQKALANLQILTGTL
jgi:outer membrane protein TolC